MELSYDWQVFQQTFYPRRRASAFQSSEPQGSVYAITEGDAVLAAFGEHEDLSDWIGARKADLAKGFMHREVVFIERAKMDQWLGEALAVPHFYNQVQLLRAKAAEDKKIKIGSAREHFLLEALKTGWNRLFPSAYGIFLRCEGSGESDIFLLVRGGTLESFNEPDLTSMGPERRRQPEDVVKYLSEKYLVPVQGLFVSEDDWATWSESENPWRDVFKAIRAKRSKLVPFRWSVMSWILWRSSF